MVTGVVWAPERAWNVVCSNIGQSNSGELQAEVDYLQRRTLSSLLVSASKTTVLRFTDSPNRHQLRVKCSNTWACWAHFTFNLCKPHIPTSSCGLSDPGFPDSCPLDHGTLRGRFFFLNLLSKYNSSNKMFYFSYYLTKPMWKLPCETQNLT